MQVKGRIGSTGIGVRVQRTHCKVSAGMDAVKGLEVVMKAPEIGIAVDEGRDGCRFRIVAPCGREIARQAAGVVGEAVAGAVGLDGDGTQVDGVIGKRPRFDTAATGGWSEMKIDTKE